MPCSSAPSCRSSSPCIAASGAIGQWRNYLLFTNGGSFDVSDPQFHKNVGFFVFKLPFLSFLVSWAFVTLVVVAIFTVIAHYLNGGIRVQSGTPSVAPQVKVHISVLLAAWRSSRPSGTTTPATTSTSPRTATCRARATPTCTPGSPP